MHSPAKKSLLDWGVVRPSVDLIRVISDQLGPPIPRSGASGQSWWVCPFHPDRNPSLAADPARGTWKCFGCGAQGDAAAMVMRFAGLSFPAAVRLIAEGGSSSTIAAAETPAKRPKKPQERPSGLAAPEAEDMLREARLTLWGSRGAKAREYLLGRGLNEPTIRAAGLGWSSGVQIPKRDNSRTYRATGIVIPWRDGENLTLVKIRQPEGHHPKYAEAFRDRPRIFPSPSAVRIGLPLIVVEGEFDALLLAQELGEMASVITLGSASMRPSAEVLRTLFRSPSWWIASDDDPAGDQCAESWPARAKRAWPPAHCNDWTEAHLAGVGLRCHWAAILRRQEEQHAAE